MRPDCLAFASKYFNKLELATPFIILSIYINSNRYIVSAKKGNNHGRSELEYNEALEVTYFGLFWATSRWPKRAGL